MVLLNDFNKDINGLLKSKFPSEKLLEVNLSSLSKNPSCSFSISSKNNNLVTIDGNSTLKWNMFSTQMETKMDMNGLSIFEVKTVPKSGLSLSTKYERFPKHINNENKNGSGSIELGGDVQCNNFHTRFRFSPTLNIIGCVNKLNKEKNSTGIMLSSTFSTSKLISPSNLNIGIMLSNNVMSYNSMKTSLGLLLKGPINKKNECFEFNRNENCNSNYSTYSISLQTNSNNQNNFTGFTSGFYLDNLISNFTFGAMITYNTTNSLNIVRSIESGSPVSSISASSSSSLSSRIQYSIGAKLALGKKIDTDEYKKTDENQYKNFNENIDQKSTEIKFKISNNMNIAYSLTHRFNKNISATFGAQFDPSRLNNPDSVKYGFLLDLGA